MKKILKYKDFLKEYVDLRHIKEVLPTKKYKHSKRVAELTKQLTDDVDIYAAAVYHDFLERGGDINEMDKILTPHALELVKGLTNEYDVDTLEDLKTSLNGKSQDIKNDILIIKLCDRCDNLKKRYFKNILSKSYTNKSAELIQYIYDNYSGDKIKMKKFIENNVLNFISKLRDKINLI